MAIASFKGEREHTLDSKGRIILPSHFRRQLDNQIVFAPGQDLCVVIYAPDTYEAEAEQLSQFSLQDEEIRLYVRFFYSRAEDAEFDAQGRVTVPPRLREYAGLERDLAIVGHRDHIGIWDRERWQEYSSEGEQQFATRGTPLGLPPVTRA